LSELSFALDTFSVLSSVLDEFSVLSSVLDEFSELSLVLNEFLELSFVFDEFSYMISFSFFCSNKVYKFILMRNYLVLNHLAQYPLFLHFLEFYDARNLH